MGGSRPQRIECVRLSSTLKKNKKRNRFCLVFEWSMVRVFFHSHPVVARPHCCCTCHVHAKVTHVLKAPAAP
eukprot:6274737-Karenia_brevis.AAC.1